MNNEILGAAASRRLLVLGLAGAAAGPAFAQTAAPGAGAAQTGTGQAGMGQAEMDHAKRTGMAGAAALMTSDIALQKGRAGGVKQFAQFEHDEQTTVAEILKSMDPNMSAPTPDPKMADMIAKLKGMEAGAAFDKAYIQGQIEGHQALLQIQEDYLKSGRNREHVSMAKLVRGMVKEHLVHLNDLTKAMS